MDAGDRDILVQGKAVLASYGLNVTESQSIVSATFADSSNSPDAFTFAFIAPGRNIAYIAWTCKRRVPPERRTAVTEFFTRANFGMIVGGFILDWNDGEYRFTASVRVRPACSCSCLRPCGLTFMRARAVCHWLLGGLVPHRVRQHG
jgi:hypothetical protein